MSALGWEALTLLWIPRTLFKYFFVTRRSQETLTSILLFPNRVRKVNNKLEGNWHSYNTILSSITDKILN